MKSPLQKGPDGLLGALDLKTLGRSPGLFGEELVPTLESMEFYLLRNRQNSTLTAAFAAINATIVAHTVPNDQVWRLKSFAIVLVRAAADAALSIDLNGVLRRATGTGGAALGGALFPPVAATDLIQQRGFFLPRGLWLGPGDRLSLTCSTTITIAGSNLSLVIDYDAMQSG